MGGWVGGLGGIDSTVSRVQIHYCWLCNFLLLPAVLRTCEHAPQATDRNTKASHAS